MTTQHITVPTMKRMRCNCRALTCTWSKRTHTTIEATTRRNNYSNLQPTLKFYAPEAVALRPGDRAVHRRGRCRERQRDPHPTATASRTPARPASTQIRWQCTEHCRFEAPAKPLRRRATGERRTCGSAQRGAQRVAWMEGQSDSSAGLRLRSRYKCACERAL